MIISVIDKVSNKEVTRYVSSDLKILNEYPEANYLYVEINPLTNGPINSVKEWSSYEFKKFFTTSEEIAIITASNTDPIVKKYFIRPANVWNH